MSHTLNYQPHSRKVEKAPGLFELRPRLLMGLMVFLFLAAGAVRLYRVDKPGVLVDREFVSAILARAFYYEQEDSVPDWQAEIARITRERQPILEPPVTEYLVSLIYRAIGSEQLWISHLLTSVFWLVGGIFLFKTVKGVLSVDAAVIATAYYLFSPLSILVSRSFQPDSLMMMLFLISLYRIVRYAKDSRGMNAAIAGGITGLALLYRPLVLFALLGAFAAVAIYRRRSWRFVLERDILLFLGPSLLLPVLYYGYGVFVAGFLRWKVDSSFLPNLYLRPQYWQGWLQLATDGIGLPVLIGAALGFPAMGGGLPRALVAGLGLGYILFGLVFTAHIYTHGYYQAQLIPIAAIPFSSLASQYLGGLRKRNLRIVWWLPVLGGLLLIL
jgi:4-amino-4-deoxy-L-arabinose transferase-like glycosyltransferase